MVKFNRTPLLSDWQDPENKRIAVEELLGEQLWWDRIDRKWWEWVMLLKAARHYGCRGPETVALGIGTGRENPLFVLANESRMVIASDIYGRGAWGKDGDVADTAMMVRPEAHWGGPLRRNRLIVASVDACDLPFGDNSFDLLFSCSSVEHFGTCEKVAQATREAYRVLRPGGIYALSVDYIINDGIATRRDKRHPAVREFLDRYDVEELLLAPAGFGLDEDIAFDVDPGEIINAREYATTGETPNGEPYPATWMRFQDYLITSLFLVLIKPE